MLERISPHLAMIGIHKNGTWAAQKIIECVQTPEEVALVAQNLRAYAPPLFLDQYGNYVVQYVPSAFKTTNKCSHASSFQMLPSFWRTFQRFHFRCYH